MEEENGEAVNLIGVADIDPDQEILRLEQMLKDGIRPPIIGIQSVRIPLSGPASRSSCTFPKAGIRRTK